MILQLKMDSIGGEKYILISYVFVAKSYWRIQLFQMNF